MIELKRRRVCTTERMELGLYGFCFGGGKDAPDPPNYAPVAQASAESARMSAEVAREQLKWAREQWADQKDMIGQITDVQLPLMMAQAEMAQRGMDGYLSMMETQQQIAWENHRNALKDRNRYERIFQPIEDDLVQEFMAYDTEGRKALEAGRAQSDVARAQDAQRKQAMMSLEGYGIDPSQTRSQALDAGLRTQQAAAQAAAGNQARQNVEHTGRALRAEAINIGKGMPSNVAASYSTALQAAAGQQGAANAANSSLANTMQGLSNNAAAWQGAGNAMGSPTAWQGQSNQAIGQWGNTLNMGYQNQLSGWNAQQQNSPWGLIGGIAGTALGTWMAEGGEVDGPGGPKDDAIPARLSDGEYVMPAEVVHRKGTEFFDKLRDKTQQEIAEQRAQLNADQQEAQVKQAAVQMEMPAEHPQHMGYGGAALYAGGGPVYPYDGPAPAMGAPVYYAEGGPVYDGSSGYAPGEYGTVIEGDYWEEPVQSFAEGGAIEKDTSYGYHGNQMTPMYMAEGGATGTGGGAAGNQNTGKTGGLWSGANIRPMFGYDSKAARQGKAEQQAARNNRAKLMQNLQQEMAAKAWQNVRPTQPSPSRSFGRADSDFSAAIQEARDRRAQELAAERAHELALEQAKAKAAASQQGMESYYDYRQVLPFLGGISGHEDLSYEDWQNLDPKRRRGLSALGRHYQDRRIENAYNPYGAYNPYQGHWSDYQR